MNIADYLSRMELVPFVDNIEKLTLENNAFRKILYTTDTIQLVLMCIDPDNEIGLEVHPYTTQFFRIEKGEGLLVLADKRIRIKDGDAIVIPANTLHNVINTSRTNPLHLYSIYSPPQHPIKLN